MATTIVSPKPSQVLGRVAELHRMLEEAGLTFDDLQRPISNREFRQKLVEFWRGDADRARQVAQAIIGTASSQPNSVAQARAILGKNFFGAEEWLSHYGVAVSEIPEFPWDEAVLNSPCPFVKGRKVKDTHFAFLGVPHNGERSMTITTLHQLHPANKQPRFYSTDPWYNNQGFATEIICSLRWYLLLKAIVPDSESKNWDEQCRTLPNEYEVPTGVEEVCKDLFCYKTSKSYLNRERYARVQDTTSHGVRVIVGYFDSDDLHVDRSWDARRSPVLGMAASRKVPGT